MRFCRCWWLSPWEKCGPNEEWDTAHGRGTTFRNITRI